MSATVLTADDLKGVLEQVAELKKRLDAVETGAVKPKPPRAFMTPKEVGRFFTVDHVKVYAACKSGELRAEKHPGRRGIEYRIDRADAQRWYDRSVRGESTT